MRYRSNYAQQSVVVVVVVVVVYSAVEQSCERPQRLLLGVDASQHDIVDTADAVGASQDVPHCVALL